MPFRRGLVSSAHPLASKAGVSVLRKGGNAVDAAVAVSLMLGVTQPAFSGIGGGGFCLIHLASGETIAVDYRERAPLASSPNMFEALPSGETKDLLNSVGPLAIATPGQIAGLCHLLETYGTLKFRKVSARAIAQARSGVGVDRISVMILRENRYNAFDKLRRFETSSRTFLRNGRIPRVGTKLRLPALASTMLQVAIGGRESFYTGNIAKRIADHIQDIGGIVSLQDLEGYEVKVRKPVEGSYRGFAIASMPPPSAGGASLIQALNVLENYDRTTFDSDFDRIHLTAESLKLVFKDKQALFGDPDFVEVPLHTLIDKEYAKRQGSRISGQTSKTGLGLSEASHGSTTHFSVIDSEGNIVAASESLECYFGSGVTIPRLGLLMNDEMHDFEPIPGRANSIQPGKRPVSSMTPTIIFKEGNPFLVLGGAGAERIVSSMVEVVSNMIDRKMSIAEALAQPRFHAAGEDLVIETGFGDEVLKRLRSMAQKLISKPAGDLYFGGIHAIQIDPEKRFFIGGADPRRLGKAVGY
jgi:gamma-glutamyltranspeptidase/glutathione hydrolase